MADIQELRDKRFKLWEQTKTFLDEHTDKDGKISDEDIATYERMEKDVVALGNQIERFEKQAHMDAKFNKIVPSYEVGNKGEYPISSQAMGNCQKGTASDEYKQAALTAIRTNFKQISNYLQEGVASDGGYLVPDEWDSRLIDGLPEENILRQLGTTITTSGLHKINIAGTKPAAAWVDEGAALTFTDTTFGQVTLDAHKLHVGVKVTNELLNDEKYDLENYLIDQFTKAIGNAEEDAFLNGAITDTSIPTGLFPSAMADSDNVVTTSTTDTKISSDDVIDLVYKLKRPYRKNAVFVMNDQIVAQIRKLKDGSGNYLWQPSYQEGEVDRILGYRVYTSAYAPIPARGAGVIAFGDMSYYQIADRGSRTFRELRELFMANDMTGFLMTERVDGILILPEAVRILKIKA